jgi:cytochrome P450
LKNAEHWKNQRKHAHGLILEALNQKYYKYPGIEARRMLAEMVKDPGNWSKLLENNTANVMTRVIWGSTAPAHDLQDDAWALLHQMSPGGPITNAMTPLLLLPGWMNGQASEARRRVRQTKWFLALENKVRQDIAGKKHDDPSFMRSFLEKQQKSSGMDDREGAFFVGMIGVAGVFTMGSPLHTFVLAMLHHPQWLARVQEEIDTKLDGRMPEAADSPNLPILRSVIKECLRWRPPVPTGKETCGFNGNPGLLTISRRGSRTRARRCVRRLSPT